MVAVLVGDQYAAQAARRNADALQRLCHPRAGNARIHQKVGFVAADVDCVAAGAAEERRKPKFH